MPTDQVADAVEVLGGKVEFAFAFHNVLISAFYLLSLWERRLSRG
jgi:hypothetical protein